MKKFLSNTRNSGKTAKRFLQGVTAAAGAAMFAPMAFAGPLAEAATGELDKAELTLIGVGILALCGVVALIQAGKRTTKA